MTGRRLTLDDIADARAYEREREGFRARIIELKKKRRIAVGPVVSIVFENRDTIRFQIQEMARAERIFSDEGIQVELDTYNPLIPEPGELSASLYIELTSRDEMERWLPRLVGIEQAVVIEITGSGANGSGPEVVRCQVDPAHAANLTREEVTAAVHFVRFELSPVQIESFRGGTVAVAIDHPEYRERTVLSDAARDSLLEDLLG
ncbi:MAG TPA: DUF3501 family protein [Acidimicrobiales bacterium]|nr:DUF3501 family protein [Acidimicrobiales bacterium]